MAGLMIASSVSFAATLGDVAGGSKGIVVKGKIIKADNLEDCYKKCEQEFSAYDDVDRCQTQCYNAF
jgi:hypothetical protein